MPIGKLDWSGNRGGYPDPVGDFSKSLGSFADRLLRKDQAAKDEARAQKQLELQEAAAGRAQAAEDRAQKNFLRQTTEREALTDMAKKYSTNAGNLAMFGDMSSDDKMDAYVNDVVAKRQARLDEINKKQANYAPLNQADTEFQAKYSQGLITPQEATQMQSLYEQVKPYREEMQQGLFGQMVAGGADPTKAATLSAQLTANLPSKADETAKMNAAIKRRDDLSKEFLKEYNKVNVARVKAGGKAGKGGLDLEAVNKSIDAQDAGYFDANSLKDKVKIVADKYPGLSTKVIKNAVQMAINDGVIDKTFDENAFTKYVSKAAAGNVGAGNYKGSTNLLSKYNEFQKEIGADFIPSAANPDVQMSRLKSVLGYTPAETPKAGTIAEKVVPKPVAPTKPVVEEAVKTPKTIPNYIEETGKKAQAKLKEVDTSLAKKAKEGKLTPLENSLRKVGFHPEQTSVERQRDIDVARKERIQDSIQRRKEVDAGIKIDKMAQDPKIQNEYQRELDKARRKQGYIGTSMRPAGYESLEDYIRTFKLKGK